MKQIDLNKLSIFIEVAKTGSFTKAALNLRLPKSKVSRNVSNLEKEMGSELFRRTTRHVQLSTTGQRLLDKIIQPLSEIKDSLEMASENEDEIEGLIKVSVPEDMGVQFVSDLVAEFMMIHPKIQIFFDLSNRRVNLVKESFDLALRVGRLHESSFKQKKICKVRLALVASPLLWKTHPRPKSVSDLETLPFLSFSDEKGLSSSLRLEKAGHLLKIKSPSLITSNNFFALKKIALRGFGYTVLPRVLTENEIRSGVFEPLFPDWLLSESDLSILYPNLKNVPLRVRKLIDFLSQRLPTYF